MYKLTSIHLLGYHVGRIVDSCPWLLSLRPPYLLELLSQGHDLELLHERLIILTFVSRRRKTGGGISKAKPLTELEEMVAENICPAQISGIASPKTVC
jgi:hypothetical protein